MPDIKISNSSACHLWNKPDLSDQDLIQVFTVQQVYEDDSHLIRRLLKCRTCGQLYFYEFYEEIDWQEGDDPQYRTWIPVDDIESANSLSKLSVFEILKYPSIRSDWPRGQKVKKIYRTRS